MLELRTLPLTRDEVAALRDHVRATPGLRPSPDRPVPISLRRTGLPSLDAYAVDESHAIWLRGYGAPDPSPFFTLLEAAGVRAAGLALHWMCGLNTHAPRRWNDAPTLTVSASVRSVDQATLPTGAVLGLYVRKTKPRIAEDPRWWAETYGRVFETVGWGHALRTEIIPAGWHDRDHLILREADGSVRVSDEPRPSPPYVRISGAGAWRIETEDVTVRTNPSSLHFGGLGDLRTVVDLMPRVVDALGAEVGRADVSFSTSLSNYDAVRAALADAPYRPWEARFWGRSRRDTSDLLALERESDTFHGELFHYSDRSVGPLTAEVNYDTVERDGPPYVVYFQLARPERWRAASRRIAEWFGGRDVLDPTPL